MSTEDTKTALEARMEERTRLKTWFDNITRQNAIVRAVQLPQDRADWMSFYQPYSPIDKYLDKVRIFELEKTFEPPPPKKN